MPVIKRYPNRKLYDTEAKQYITLEGIADLIRRGEEVRVIDNASGEDLTALTLTQVISEQEKKPGGFLPRTILAGLIQAGGDRLSMLQRNLISPLVFLQHVDDEIKRRVQALIKQGELAETEGQRLLEKLMSKSRISSNSESPVSYQNIEKEVEQILSNRQIPTREDLNRILGQLDALTGKLDEIESPESKTDTE